MSKILEIQKLFKLAAADDRLKLLHSVIDPTRQNGFANNKHAACGVKAGLPCISLPLPSPEGYHALYIELKRNDRPVELTALQTKWIHDLSEAGNYACVCRGAEKAMEIINNYLSGNLKEKS